MEYSGRVGRGAIFSLLIAAIPIPQETRRLIVDFFRSGKSQEWISAKTLVRQGTISKIIARARKSDPTIPLRAKDGAHRAMRPVMHAASQIGPASRPASLDDF